MSIVSAVKNNKKVTVLVFLLLASLVGNLILFGEYQSEKHRSFYQYTAIPDIELANLMGYYGLTVLGGEVVTRRVDGMIAFGEITGFVAFIDQSDQPRGLRQYYSIEASNELDNRGNQIFYLVETLKMAHVSERKLNPESFFVTQNNQQEMTLESEGGTIIGIDKVTGTIALDGGEAYLITRDMEFRDFMKDLYGY